MPACDLTAMGVPVRVEATGAHAEEVITAVREAWGRCLALPTLEEYAGHQPHVITVELVDPPVTEVDERIGWPASAGPSAVAFARPSRIARHRIDSLLIALSQEVTMVGLTANTGRFLLLHAAVLAAPGGQAVAFVGPSGAGKTTLAQLLGRSWGYLSDETAVIARDGTVVPYPKPLSVTRPWMNLKLESAPDALGLAATPPSARLAGLVLLDRSDPQRDGAELVALPTARALVLLAGETSGLARLDHPLGWLADLWSSLPLTGVLQYGEAAAAGRLISGLVERRRRAPDVPE